MTGNELEQGLLATWTAGDYGRVAHGLARGAEAFYGRLGVVPEACVLDVACGTGQIALRAARDGARVTGLDLAAPWIDQARRAAGDAGLSVRFDVGNAEALPYDDGSFDLSVSLIGAMFAPRPERVAAELIRVTRPGGRIVMGNWTPECFVGEMFRVVARHAPPPDMPSPLLWGDEPIASGRFAGPGVAGVQLSRHPYLIHYDLPPEDVLDFYAEHFGPVRVALAAQQDGGRALRRDLLALWRARNEADGDRTAVTAEVLDVVVEVAPV